MVTPQNDQRCDRICKKFEVIFSIGKKFVFIDYKSNFYTLLIEGILVLSIRVARIEILL